VTSAAATASSFPELVGRAAPERRPLWEYVRASGLRSLVICASKNPNAKIIVLLVSPTNGRPVLAVKVPTTAEAARTVEAEGRLLVELDGVAPTLAATIPRIVDLVECDGHPGVVMTAVDGLPLKTSYLRWRHTATPARVADDFAAIDRWAAELQRRTAGPSAPLDMAAGVASRLETRFADVNALRDDLDRLSEIWARLREHATPRTAVHGDLWLGNILLDGGKVSGVVDWEGGTASGEPVRDLVRFALMYALFLDRRTRVGRRVAGHRVLRAGDWGAGVAYALDGTGWFPELFRRFLRDGLARLGASSASWRDAALAGIAETAAFTDDDEFARLHLELFRRLASERRARAGHRVR
jgi:aminoglycoside phosphotransferase (APT) family kinase protein